MKKKLVFITLSLEGGGAEKIITRLLFLLSGEFKIELVTFYKRGRYLNEVLSIPDLEYHCLNAETGNTISFALRLRKIILNASPHKVISFLYYPNIVTYLALVRLNIPYILSERSNHRLYFTGSVKHKIWKVLLKKAYFKASAIISISNENKTAISSDFNVPVEKIFTVYNGLSFSDLDRLKEEPVTDLEFKKDNYYIVAVGNLTRAKNYPLLIESFSILHSKNTRTRLIILGQGEMGNRIRALINKLNLQDAVLLKGYTVNPYSYLRNASCYVLSSDWEGFPNSLLEAMYVCGHVVSTDCPTGPSEIISNNEDGLLCRMNDPKELSSAMERMCFDNDFRNYVYENSRRKIAKFDEQIMVKEYRTLFLK